MPLLDAFGALHAKLTCSIYTLIMYKLNEARQCAVLDTAANLPNEPHTETSLSKAFDLLENSELSKFKCLLCASRKPFTKFPLV